MTGKSDFPASSGRRGRHHLLSEINVTPMVDVMLVLLIIFIVTGQIAASGTEVDLPDARANKLASQEEPIQISIDAEQNIYLGETLLVREAFADTLYQLALASPEPGELRVFVRADRSLPYGSVMEVVSQISQAGFSKVAFISNPAPAAAAAEAP